MITFVLYDDMKEFREKTEKLIREIVKKEGKECVIESYEKYNEKFRKTIEDNQVTKIYLLDIDVPNSESGIDIARRIRKNDWNSVIILITSHIEMGYEALKAKIMLLDFISKYHNWKNNLIKTVKEAIKRIDQNNILMIESGTMTHRIYLSDILYIVRDNVDRKCSIKTIDGHDISINKSLSEIGEKLDDRFYLSHRSCYVNIERIKSIDWKKNEIYFEEGEKIDY